MYKSSSFIGINNKFQSSNKFVLEKLLLHEEVLTHTHTLYYELAKKKRSNYVFR